MTYDLAPEDKPPPPPDEIPAAHPRQNRRRSPCIESDLPCVQCGYNLRTLARAGRCPECGLAVLMSSAGDNLAESSPGWLLTVKRGLAMMLWATALNIVEAMVAVTSSSGLEILLEAGAASLGLYGVWCFTATEPRETLRHRGAGLQTGLRALGVLRASCALALIVLARCVGTPSQAVAVASGCGTVITAALTACILVYLRRFVARTDDVSLERETAVVAWGLIGSMALIIVFAPLTVLLQGGRSAGPPICFSVVGALGLMLLLGWSIKLLWTYHGVLKWAAWEAQHRQED